jgi:hypothetical protein
MSGTIRGLCVALRAFLQVTHPGGSGKVSGTRLPRPRRMTVRDVLTWRFVKIVTVCTCLVD